MALFPESRSRRTEQAYSKTTNVGEEHERRAAPRYMGGHDGPIRGKDGDGCERRGGG
jgi:hypothetical protein